MTPRFVVLLGLSLALVACDAGAAQVADETAARLGEIRSGHLTMSLIFTRSDPSGGSGEEVGFSIEGPFSIPDDGGLPVADLVLREELDGQVLERRFISDGTSAYVQVDGSTYELDEAATESLKVPDADEEGGAFAALDVDEWLVEPALEDGDEGTVRVSGGLDTTAVYRDLLEMAAGYGAIEDPGFSEEDARQLQASVTDAGIVVVSGKDDKLLRDLRLDITLGIDGSSDIGRVLGMVGEVRIQLDMAIEDPNEAVEVEAPEDAVPL